MVAYRFKDSRSGVARKNISKGIAESFRLTGMPPTTAWPGPIEAMMPCCLSDAGAMCDASSMNCTLPAPEATMPRIARESTLAEALRYAITRRVSLERLLENCRIEVDSNIVELLTTAKMSGVDPHAWLPRHSSASPMDGPTAKSTRSCRGTTPAERPQLPAYVVSERQADLARSHEQSFFARHTPAHEKA